MRQNLILTNLQNKSQFGSDGYTKNDNFGLILFT